MMCDVSVARVVFCLGLVGAALGGPRPQWPPQYGAPFHQPPPPPGPYAPQPHYPQQQPPQNTWHRQFEGYNYTNPNTYQQPQPNYAYQGGGGGGFGAYPQIYHVGNLVIIANPVQQPACPPSAPIIPPVKKIAPPQTDSEGNDGLDNRFGGGDGLPYSDCTWAVVACCSPGYANVRYNCFDVLGCSGYFFDVSACDPQVVASATQAASDFYSKGKSNNNSRNKNNARPAAGETNKLD